VQELLADPDSQWHEYRSRGAITKNQVAALLKDFEIRPIVVHPTKRADLSRHGYRAAQFEEVFARFLPPEPNIRTLKRAGRRKDVKMFGCSDDWSKGTAKADRQRPIAGRQAPYNKGKEIKNFKR